MEFWADRKEIEDYIDPSWNQEQMEGNSGIIYGLHVHVIGEKARVKDKSQLITRESRLAIENFRIAGSRPY